MDCENRRHLTVVGLHDTGPWSIRRLLVFAFTAVRTFFPIAITTKKGTAVIHADISKKLVAGILYAGMQKKQFCKPKKWLMEYLQDPKKVV